MLSWAGRLTQCTSSVEAARSHRCQLEAGGAAARPVPGTGILWPLTRPGRPAAPAPPLGLTRHTHHSTGTRTRTPGATQALLEAGADANAKDENDNTALHYAAGYGNTDAAALLLDRCGLSPQRICSFSVLLRHLLPLWLGRREGARVVSARC